MEPLPYLGFNVLQTNLILTGVLVVLLIMSAFFSASETAFSSVSVLRLKTYAEEKKNGAIKGLYICEHFDKALVTILIGNNLVNIASTTICAYMLSLTVLNPTLANVLNTVVMTIIILIFGEILPKCRTKVDPEKRALKYANTLYLLMKILTPISFLFLKLQAALTKKEKVNKEPTITETELESIIDTMEEEGVIDSEDAELFQGVLDLSEKTAHDVMTPRVDVEGVEINSSLEDIKKVFVDTQYSRIPVYVGDIDHIVGILSQKDFFTALITNNKADVKKLMVEPLLLNENMRINDIIRKMQHEKKHMAVIVDEFGGTAGIITLEDAIEQMVGKIYDEHDEVVVEESIEELGDNKFIIDAEVGMDDLFDKLEIEHLPQGSEHSSVGAFLFELAESVPYEGQTLTYNAVDEVVDENANYVTKVMQMDFKITSVEDNRIREVSLEAKHLEREDLEENKND